MVSDLMGAALVACMIYVSRWLGWFATLGTLPVMYLIYRSYRLYLGRLESEKLHAEELAALHLRTIEALALAIEANCFARMVGTRDIEEGKVNCRPVEQVVQDIRKKLHARRQPS